MKQFTIGYGGRKPHDFTAILLEHRIRSIVDVRLRPDRASMGIYSKAKDPGKGIAGLLAASGIEYFSLPELGNVFLEQDDWPDRYQQLVDRAGDLLMSRLDGIPEPYCLLCAERRVDECHRRIIAEFLTARGCRFEHLE
jgi:uncharacterized protein (DUF488 family)